MTMMTNGCIEQKIVTILGNHIDTDAIFPTRFVHSFLIEEISPHVFEDVYPGFAGRVKNGGIILAGEDFGCGSAREQAASSLMGAGTSLIIARYFSRSFYRNSVNIGLPLLEMEKMTDTGSLGAVGDELSIDFRKGILKNKTRGQIFEFTPPDPFILKVMEAGGICNYYNRYGYEDM